MSKYSVPSAYISLHPPRIPCPCSVNKHLGNIYYVPGSKEYMENNIELNFAPLELRVWRVGSNKLPKLQC